MPRSLTAKTAYLAAGAAAGAATAASSTPAVSAITTSSRRTNERGPIAHLLAPCRRRRLPAREDTPEGRRRGASPLSVGGSVALRGPPARRGAGSRGQRGSDRQHECRDRVGTTSGTAYGTGRYRQRIRLRYHIRYLAAPPTVPPAVPRARDTISPTPAD